jgi:hypothetical protein
MNTNDKFDKIFEKQNNKLFVAWGEGTLSYHGKTGYKSGVFNLDGSINIADEKPTLTYIRK